VSLRMLTAGRNTRALARNHRHGPTVNPLRARVLRFTAASIIALASLAPGSTARAQATFRLTADASAFAADSRVVSNTPPTQDTGIQAILQLPGQGLIGQSAQANANFAGSTSASSASFVLPTPGGFEGATLHATVSMSSGTPGGNDLFQTASASSGTVAVYDDVLTPGGPPPGTLVTLRVILTLSRSVAYINTGTACSMRITFGDPGDTLSPIAIVDAGISGNLVVADSFTVQLPAGTAHPVEWRLSAQSFGSAGASPNGPGLANAVVDDATTFPNVVKLYIDAITPGASYTLESGADLRSSAPVNAVGPSVGQRTLALAPASRNPAHGAVALMLTIPAGGAHGDVEVFDVAGHELWRSPAGTWPAGSQAVTWPGTTARGERVSPGVYLVRVATDRGAVTQRVVDLR
jgi:hypothetical protein